MMQRVWAAALFVALSLTAAASAEAPTDTVEDVAATGDLRVREAVAAYARGDFAEARRLFEQEHARAPTARTLRGLGVVASREQRHVDAVRLLRAALAADVKPLTAELRQGVESMLADSEARVAALSLMTAQPEATLDEAGVLLVREPNGIYLLAPGAHRLTCAAEGYEPSQLLVQLAPGERQEFAVSLVPLTVVPPREVVVPAPLRDTALHAQPRRPRLRRAMLGLAGSTGLLLVGAAVSGGVGFARARAITRHCHANADGLCSPEERDAQIETRKLEMLGKLTAAWLGLAGAGAVGTIGLLPFYYGGTSGERSAGMRLVHFF